MVESNSNRAPLTDSPWFWGYLFATAGLIALILMGPKFSARQAQIERKAQGRQRAAQQASGAEPTAPLSSQQQTEIGLKPLFFILSVIFAVAWAVLLWKHFRQRPNPKAGAR